MTKKLQIEDTLQLNRQTNKQNESDEKFMDSEMRWQHSRNSCLLTVNFHIN